MSWPSISETASIQASAYRGQPVALPAGIGQEGSPELHRLRREAAPDDVGTLTGYRSFLALLTEIFAFRASSQSGLARTSLLTLDRQDS